jgi:hypothetical protein
MELRGQAMKLSCIGLGQCRPADQARIASVAICLLMAGCSPGEGAVTAGAEMPKTVAGKWRMTVSVDGGGGGMPMTRCDPETPIDDLLFIGLPGNGRNCTERTFEQTSATSWSLHSVCSFVPTGGRKADVAVKIDTRVSGDLKTRYQLESKQVMSAPMNGVSQQTIVQIGERIGDC